MTIGNTKNIRLRVFRIRGSLVGIRFSSTKCNRKEVHALKESGKCSGLFYLVMTTSLKSFMLGTSRNQARLGLISIILKKGNECKLRSHLNLQGSLHDEGVRS